MSSPVEHTDVGAYALGLLEDDDRRAFEAHLRQCGQCRAELQQMQGAAGILHNLRGTTTTGVFPPAPAAPGDPEDGFGTRVAPGGVPGGKGTDELGRRRARRRWRYVVGSAAAAALLAAGVVVGSVIGEENPEVPAQAWTESHSGRNAANGASGVVRLQNKQWGTRVELELSDIRGPKRCRLEAVSRSGKRSVVMGWRVPPKGYGVPGSPDPLIAEGGTALSPQDVSRFEVRLEGGGTLLTIPM
jgi:hypothetical protein